MTHQNPELHPLAADGAQPPAVAKKRRIYTKKRLLIPASALLFIIILVSCSNDTSPVADNSSVPAAPTADSAEPVTEPMKDPAAAEPASAEPAVGTPFSLDMGNGSVARVTIVTAERSASVADTSFPSPPQNGSYLTLDVLWETESGTTNVNPFYFSAKDADGRAAEMNIFANGQLGTGEILPGDKSRGVLIFDISPGPATIMISNPLMQEVGRIQIPG